MSEYEVKMILERCKNSSREQLSIESIEKLFIAPNWAVRKVAIDIFGNRKDISVRTVSNLLSDRSEDVRLAALSAFIGREDVPAFLFMKCIDSFESEPVY